MNRLLCLSAAILIGTASALCAADDQPPTPKVAVFIRPAEINLTTLLPPPPAVGSDQAKAEFAFLHQLQGTRTDERRKIAEHDQRVNAFTVVGPDLGPAFTADALPLTAAFMKRVLADSSAVVNPAKDVWARQRPGVVDATLKSCNPSKSGSYPSGHTTAGFLTAIVLSDMVPERRDVLFADAARYGESRMVCAMHFPSDVEAGKTTAAVLAIEMRHNPVFLQEFAAARAEVRQALGLK